MTPSKRNFTTRGSSTTEAALLTRGASQLYISLGDTAADGAIAVRIYHKPLVLLIWWGPVLMAFAACCRCRIAGCGSAHRSRPRRCAGCRRRNRSFLILRSAKGSREARPMINSAASRRMSFCECAILRDASFGVLRMRERPGAKADRDFLHVIDGSFAASAACAVQPDEIMSDPAKETRARDLSRELRCMVCQNQSIDDSEAPLARDLRLLVRERIAAGDSDTQVIDFLVARYGEFVLLKPRFNPHTLVLWLLPPLR